MKKKLFTFLITLFSVWLTGSTQVIETIVLPPANKTGGIPLMEALQKRASQRKFSEKELSQQELSDLLWAAFGVNRPEGGRTAPSARNWKEIDIYLIKSDGWYIYEPIQHALLKMGNQDLREYAGSQDFVKTAPLNLIYVADFDRMTNTTEQDQIFYSACDVGFIAQNVYLYCASSGLATVVRGIIDKQKTREIFRLGNTQHAILAQTAGHPEN